MAQKKKSKKRAVPAPKMFRVHFTVELDTYRDVEADDKTEAMEAVDGDWVDMYDLERAEPANIRVMNETYVDEVSSDVSQLKNDNNGKKS